MNDFAVIKFSIAFVFGILLLPLVQVNILSLIILIILLLLLTIILKRKRVFEKYNIFLTVISLLLIISLGNITSQFSKVQLNTFVSNLYKEKNVIVSGKIDKIELEREYEIQFLLSADKFMVNDITVNDKIIFLCKLRGNEKGRKEFYKMIKPGFKIEVTGRFKKGRERRNPGEFDYNAYLKTKGIENWKELRQQAIEKYGQDFSKIDYFGYQNYVWQGPKSSIALEYKPKEGSSVVLLMVSN